MKLPKLMLTNSDEVRAFRKKIGLNQADFWSRLGVTQSGGSRYETGRNIPEPVQLLLHMTYAPEDRALRLLGVLRAWRSMDQD